MLTIENLHVNYGNIRALHGINLTIEEGEIVTIIGANGAGKSTTLRAISGLVPAAAESRLTFQGQDLKRLPADKSRQRAGHFPCSRRAASVREPDRAGKSQIGDFRPQGSGRHR